MTVLTGGLCAIIIQQLLNIFGFESNRPETIQLFLLFIRINGFTQGIHK